MSQGTRELKHRIKSVTSTQQITKAMEAVAASKMKRAQNAAVESRPYALKALEVLAELQSRVSKHAHPLLDSRTIKKVLIIAFSTDKGLCGGLNTALIKTCLETIEKYSDTATVELLTIGKKARDFFKRSPYSIVASFMNLGDRFNVLDIAPASRIAVHDFKEKKYDEVLLIYTNFISTLSQETQVKSLLPLTREIIKDIAELGEDAIKKESAQGKDFKFEYNLEPSREKLLEVLLPRLVEMQIFHTMLEANASEHSARMIAMKNATDNASDIIDELTLTFNQLRQSSITKEISEIAAGVEALKEQEE